MDELTFALLNVADTLCESVKDTPCGCESCPLWGENGDFICDLAKLKERCYND